MKKEKMKVCKQHIGENPADVEEIVDDEVCYMCTMEDVVNNKFPEIAAMFGKWPVGINQNHLKNMTINHVNFIVNFTLNIFQWHNVIIVEDWTLMVKQDYGHS